MIKLTYYSTPGHGYLKAPKELVEQLGVVEQVSSYSYVDAGHVYLEEDSDANILINRMKELKLKYKIIEKVVTERTESKIRANSYTPLFFKKFSVGDCIYRITYQHPFEVEKFTVTDVTPGRLLGEFNGRKVYLLIERVGEFMSEEELQKYTKLFDKFNQLVENYSSQVSFDMSTATIRFSRDNKPYIGGAYINNVWRVEVYESGVVVSGKVDETNLEFKGDEQVEDLINNIKRYTKELFEATTVDNILMNVIPRAEWSKTPYGHIIYFDKSMTKDSISAYYLSSFRDVAKKLNDEFQKYEKPLHAEQDWDDDSITCIKITKR